MPYRNRIKQLTFLSQRLLACVCFLAAVATHQELLGADARTLPAFDLPSIDGTKVNLSKDSASPVTVLFFVGTECPLVKIYASRVQKTVQAINSTTADQANAVRLIGVCSTAQDSLDDLKRFADEQQIGFTLVKDFGGEVGKSVGAKRTSEVVVVDQNLAIRYQGRVDDEYEPGVSRTKANRDDLAEAINEVLGGKDVSVPMTNSVGCLIGYASDEPVTTDLTYARDIAPILDRQCNECHREGDIAPFALTDYAEVVGWGPMMVEVMDEQRMPPWHADPNFGKFLNARHMPEKEKQTIKEWVNGGMPFGNVDDLPKKSINQPLAVTKDGNEWQFSREPDVVVPMAKQPFLVPADESVDYQYYVVDPGFKEDTWVVGTEVRPGNRSVVHHCIVFIRPPDNADFRGIGWLGAYVPGQRGAEFPPGYARRIPAGSKLVFQMHYTPTGTPQEDLTQVGLLLGKKEEIDREIITLTAINSEFEIPPHADDYPVTASIRQLPNVGELLAVAPHMHLRGKSFRVFANHADSSGNEATPETLLSVPNYDFNWQHVYAFAEPLPLNTVDKIWFEAQFDNSANNPANPDPSAPIYWGDQTDEEMAIGFFEVAIPRNVTDRLRQQAVKRTDQSSALSSQDKQKAQQLAEKYITRWDKNQDGKLNRDELPRSVAHFGMDQLDRNGNGTIELEEIEQLHLRRLKNQTN
ncbi:redoxin domain-containing protein [Stieleria sp. JC731]|uniref:redoxin domain-containing protein n=1 Tax=Pirellulaceae TaxID=2691357 RepID=UPI001E50CB31|nr:redoxin domain-containing protein [Stieleria sp. JC731]MCC9598955.1 redoxin domain-containing protein [Stieleria sp. JC731]